jgi:Ca-activated chloride channel family protein
MPPDGNQENEMPDASAASSNTTQLILTPLKPAVIEGAAQKLPVLVRVQTPDPEPGQQKARKPYHVSLVLDRSGSMSGDPIIEAVRCARHVVDRLEPTDVASLVIFDNRIETLVPAQPVGDRKALYAALARIHSGGNTDLCGGWKAGAASLVAGASEAALARVILLSDGNANAGETRDVAEIAAFCEEAAKGGVTTSTYGLGRDFNEELMVEMARKGLGNHYYGDTAADLFEPFAEEFDLISSLHSRHVRLSLGSPQGVKITLLNDYPVEDRDGFPVVRLPDIPWGAEAWALVELVIPAGLALESGNQFLQASVTSATPEGEPVSWPEATLALKAMSPPAWDALLPDPLVAERLAELAAAALLTQARVAADAGDWEAIKALLAEAQQRYAQFPWVLEVLGAMALLAEERNLMRFKKEALYSSRKMGSRLSAKEEMLAGLADQSGSPTFLRRKKSQGKAQFGDRPDQDAR